MIRIDGLFKVRHVTGRTFCRCAGISGRMTLQTVRVRMCPGQREGSHAMVENIISTSCGMTSQARGAVVCVPGHPVVIIIRFRIHVASDAGELCIISRIGMAVDTRIPFAFVFATVNGEVWAIMIEGGRKPGGFGMTGRTICRKHQNVMIRISGRVIVVLMTTDTGGGCVQIVPVMTGGAIVGDQCMGTI